ncbi:MAG: hypothetical protein CMN85_10630 [Spongiibacteraceae bacterium]|nr:hypothetical protein [Spongiibacteraceae bacterium]|tara:strand:+ start:20891 stop:21298 length:408 start_codon:yes stop_codon:yes gene_type:complete
MAKSFSAQVDSWILKSRRRTEAVIKTAVQELAEEANKPVSKGGRVRVDTGFLIGSFVGSINSPPTGPSDRATESNGDGDVSLIIANARPGETIYLGWSANYAKYREAYDGFRDAAAQRWPEFVRKAVAEAKRRIR